MVPLEDTLKLPTWKRAICVQPTESGGIPAHPHTRALQIYAERVHEIAYGKSGSTHLTSRTMSVRMALNQSYAKYKMPHLGSMACTRSTHLHWTQSSITRCHLSNSLPKAE